MKYSFKDDYSEGCHPRILELLQKHNMSQEVGYGEDQYSIKAKQLIREKLQSSDADIHFVSGGTQANLIVIASALRPHESVIAAVSGHIHTHEAGAIEACGHKINAVVAQDGKVTVSEIQKVLDEHIIIPHMVKPKMVYISQSTELGSIYSKDELKTLSDFCHKNNLLLFMDGARLGSALNAQDSDFEMKDLAQYCDVFYIGGTKNGALAAEAIVICNPELQKDFGYHLKQHGALISKGRFTGLQFLALFQDDLFHQLARHANELSQKLAKAFEQRNISLLTAAKTNQIFPILSYEVIHKLEALYSFYIWEKQDANHAAIRLICSWATPEKKVEAFIQDLDEILK